ncbi:anti-sigma factor [Streptomyces antibioticus]|uniref:anti-sigma factor n=1 Tax=Streptomyces antibioticus TaxID=1890 RepID=UPI00196119D1|nr:anti-sigma factor [Streptomyces sp. S9]
MTTTTDLHALTGAYAVDALDDEELAAFERHLTSCDACGQEAAEFAATAGRLALASTVRTRPAMRDRVLQRITSVRQMSPGVAASERLRRGARLGRATGWWVLAASVAATAAFGAGALWQYERAQDAQDRSARAERLADDMAAVLAAPDARSRSAKVAGGAGTLVVSADRDRAVFVASGVAPPPPGEVYQLWFAEGGKMRSAGLMDPGRSDQAVILQGTVGGASGIGITVEPAGGSEQPTSAPIVLLGVPA